ncbi:DNA polymerase [Gemella sp. zg-1178]|uniref:DNA polymerase n=1 Tax=Gemella sp. zg-1178 TaxID=2840372 RepID=UPI001C058D32|nr:DNA polymerase [Gemella sp. zg-1178]
MEKLSIDIETFSSVNLAKSGVYRYVESDDFEILLFAYSINDEPANIVDVASGEKIPQGIVDVLKDNTIAKWAFNAQFERICLSRYLGLKAGEYLNPMSWRCTMIWSAYMGLPLSLEGVGTVLGLDKQKLTEGKDLIRYFCVPCNPTKSNGQRTRNYYYHDEKKWQQFKEYNKRDVETEQAIQTKLKKFPVPDFIWDEYILDQRINDCGILVDKEFVKQAIKTDEKVRNELLLDLQEITGLDNPNSVVQLKEWLLSKGIEVESLDKKLVMKLVKETKGEIAEVLGKRLQLAKSSVKKYQAMNNVACEDNRCRGMFQFLGANRTGRFSGRLVQLQNLPQNHMKDLSEVRELFKQKDSNLELLYDDIPKVLSELIRTAFIPSKNKKFYVADFSAIEARVIAWLAGESWREKVFKENGDIYCASASQMFGVPVEKHGANNHLRQKGKIAELALGYGGSIGALTAMGALDMGLAEEELKPLVDVWRESNPNIVDLWWSFDKAVKDAVKGRTTTRKHGIEFNCKSGLLRITLPSKRQLTYIKPRIDMNKFGSESVTYEGVGTTKKWERIESYGPKFVENIVQGIARDILLYAMKNLSDYDIVAHVHDEVIIEWDKNIKIEDIIQVMNHVPDWAKGLMLNADGYVCDFYKKD